MTDNIKKEAILIASFLMLGAYFNRQLKKIMFYIKKVDNNFVSMCKYINFAT